MARDREASATAASSRFFTTCAGRTTSLSSKIDSGALHPQKLTTAEIDLKTEFDRQHETFALAPLTMAQEAILLSQLELLFTRLTRPATARWRPG